MGQGVYERCLCTSMYMVQRVCVNVDVRVSVRVSAWASLSVNLFVCMSVSACNCVPVVRREWCTQSQTTTLKQAVLRAHSVDPPALPPRPWWRLGDASVTGSDRRGPGRRAGGPGASARRGPRGPPRLSGLEEREAAGHTPDAAVLGAAPVTPARLSCCGRGHQVSAGRPGVRPGAGPPGGE